MVICSASMGSWPSDFALNDHKACTAVASKAAARLETSRVIDRKNPSSETVGSLLRLCAFVNALLAFASVEVSSL